MAVSRSLVEHMLKVAVWKYGEEHHNLDLVNNHVYFCGSNVACTAKTETELQQKVLHNDIALLPKTILVPAKESEWGTVTVTCILFNDIETYEFYPEDLAVQNIYDLREAFYAFCMVTRQEKCLKVLLPKIWKTILKTSNFGFH